LGNSLSETQMNLDEFVKEVLTEIISGIRGAQEV
jgi:hypothetical protein